MLVETPTPTPPEVTPKPKPKPKPKLKQKSKKQAHAVARATRAAPPASTVPPKRQPTLPKPLPLEGPPAPLEPTVATPSKPPAPPASTLKLDLDWRTFERTFAVQAREEREAYREQKLAIRRSRGGYGKLSARVRKALSTNQGWVKPGNQEPLGKRQRLFHNYIERIHEQRIHPIFGESFWESLSSFTPDHPLNNWNLHTVAEFEIFANGTISEVRVVKSSGNAVFDAAAVDSIYRSSPFPAPPKAVLSWNERVYLRWGFYRSPRMCGVFNVEPFILTAPDAEKERISVDDFVKEDG